LKKKYIQRTYKLSPSKIAFRTTEYLVSDTKGSAELNNEPLS